MWLQVGISIHLHHIIRTIKADKSSTSSITKRRQKGKVGSVACSGPERSTFLRGKKLADRKKTHLLPNQPLKHFVPKNKLPSKLPTPRVLVSAGQALHTLWPFSSWKTAGFSLTVVAQKLKEPMTAMTNPLNPGPCWMVILVNLNASQSRSTWMIVWICCADFVPMVEKKFQWWISFWGMGI